MSVNSSSAPVAVVATISSDAHSWNLVVLQLLLEEHGYTVHNLGPCTPPAEVVDCLRFVRPDLVVLSTVNGHGLIELPQLVRSLRGTRVVVGGKLNTTRVSAGDIRRLVDIGVDRVFTESESLEEFFGYLRALDRSRRRPLRPAHREMFPRAIAG
ncbi:cobalamin B12-binding domain-containing protein [Streptomyces sp. NPDC055107]